MVRYSHVWHGFLNISPNAKWALRLRLVSGGGCCFWYRRCGACTVHKTQWEQFKKKKKCCYFPFYAPLLQQGPVWHFPSSWGESSQPDNETETSGKKVRNAGGPQGKVCKPDRQGGGRGKPTDPWGRAPPLRVTLNIHCSFWHCDYFTI